MDKTDKTILKTLSNDATTTAKSVANKLLKNGIRLSERAVQKRISIMLKNNIIKGSTILLENDIAGKVHNRLLIVKFKNVNNFLKRIDDYTNYIMESPFCTFSARTQGEFDWIHYKCFPSKQLADKENDLFRSIFNDLIEKYYLFDTAEIKNNFHTIIDSNDIETFLIKYTKK